MVISGPKQLAGNSQKTVLSEPHNGSIKQTNTSQVLVSETVPDRRVQPSRQAKKTRFEKNPVSSTVAVPPRRQPRCDTSTRNRRKFKLDVTDPDLLIPIKQTRVTTRHSSDLREPQPSPSDSQPAVRSLCLRPPLVSLLCLCPAPHLEAQAQRAPVPVALIVLHLCLRHHPRAAYSRLRTPQAQRPPVQPAHHGQCHPNCLRWSALSTPCSQVPEISRACHDEKSNGPLERTTTAYYCTEASCHAAAEPTKACLSASSSKRQLTNEYHLRSIQG